MTTYLVPAGYGQAELVEKKSKFISRVWPVPDEDAALARIKETKEKHWDATHNVYAYIIREGGIMRYSDDGEPGGTSGLPTLNVFRSEEISDVCCVVTRYFGGTLLGAGGLVRAYSASAKLALDKAGISRMANWKEIHVTCSYSQYERLRRLIEDQGAVVSQVDYGADVALGLLAREDRAEALLSSIADFSAGTAVSRITGERFMAVSIK